MKQIALDIKNKEFSKLYVLYGSESYLRTLYLDNLLNALEVKTGDMNFTRFSEKGARDDDVLEICETFPFFSERRVVLLDGLGLFSEKHEQLEAYLSKLPDYLVLIVNETDADKRGKLYKTAAKYGHIAEFSEMDEKSLMDWTVKELASVGKKIKKDTCEMFVAGVGKDLNYLNNEIEKLIAYTDGRDTVTDADIKAVCSPVVENKIFDLVSAVADGNRKKALEKYNDLLTLKEAPMKILFLLARQFDQLLHINELLDEGYGVSVIADKLKMNPYVVKKSVPASKRYSKERLKEAVFDMVKSEEDVKTGSLDDRLSVELMIIKYSA